MWLGRRMLGGYLEIPARCTDASGDEVSPTAAPTYTIYDVTDSVVTGANDVKIEQQDKPTRTGWFRTFHFLDSNFSTGLYGVLVEWSYSGGTGAKEYYFEIVAGGNNKGAYIGLYHYDQPHAKFIIGLTDGGTLEFRKNPAV